MLCKELPLHPPFGVGPHPVIGRTGVTSGVPALGYPMVAVMFLVKNYI